MPYGGGAVGRIGLSASSWALEDATRQAVPPIATVTMTVATVRVLVFTVEEYGGEVRSATCRSLRQRFHATWK